MAHMTVQPRPTPAERSNEEIMVEVDEALTVLALTIEDWVTPRQAWEVYFARDTLTDAEQRRGACAVRRRRADVVAHVPAIPRKGARPAAVRPLFRLNGDVIDDVCSPATNSTCASTLFGRP